MKRAAALLIALSLIGCSSHHSALKSTPDSPKIIYAMPQSEAFAMAHQAMVSAPRRNTVGEYRTDAIRGELSGYRLDYHGWYYFHAFTQNLYVIPVTGVAPETGQEITGFRFLITGAGPKNGYAFLRAAAQDRSLAKTLNAALDATGTATPVMNLRIRPYDEDRNR